MFPDGGGDFSFVAKLVRILLDLGAMPNNIYLVIIPHKCEDLNFKEFSAVKKDSIMYPDSKDTLGKACEVYK